MKNNSVRSSNHVHVHYLRARYTAVLVRIQAARHNFSMCQQEEQAIAAHQQEHKLLQQVTPWLEGMDGGREGSPKVDGLEGALGDSAGLVNLADAHVEGHVANPYVAAVGRLQHLASQPHHLK